MADELLRDIFREDVPGWEWLEPQVRAWLSDSRCDLSYIRERVFEHIFESFEDQDEDGETGEDSDAACDAMNLAYSVIDGLIENLPVDEVNCRRLQAYIKELDCLKSYVRLLRDFREFLSAEERQQVLADGIERFDFIAELAPDWE